MPDQQSPLGSPSSAFPDFGFASGYGPNGFDFGLSAPKTGLGYGLFGDLRTLRAAVSGQPCDGCPPDEPCPTCQGGESAPTDVQRQIIKTQIPIPLPGLIPPPPIGVLPPSPGGPVVIGDPNAWWNWTPNEVGDWARGIFEARPSKEVAAKCEAQLENDERQCEKARQDAESAAGPQAGSREWQECRKHAMTRYGECRSKNGRTLSPPYPNWYGNS